MSQPDRPSQEQLTPEARRELLRAFGDRMLLKLTAMDDPEDMPGVERAVRAAAAIERIYSRCDRAETQSPDPRKLEAERARHTSEAIQARVHLAQDLQWGEKRRKGLGPWWDAAETKTDAQTQALATEPGLQQAAATAPSQTPAPVQAPAAHTAHPQAANPAGLNSAYADRVAAVVKASADLSLKDLNEPFATSGRDPPP